MLASQIDLTKAAALRIYILQSLRLRWRIVKLFTVCCWELTTRRKTR